MSFRIGPFSYNSKTGKVGVDRRTREGKEIATYCAMAAVSVAVGIVVVKVVQSTLSE